MSVDINSTRRPAITQHDLAEFRDLRDQLAALTRQAREKRRRLVHLVESDAPVEAGPLRVRIRVCPQRRLTREALVAAFGQDGFDYLRGEVAPTEYRHLIIEQDDPWTGESSPDRSGVSPRRRSG